MLNSLSGVLQKYLATANGPMPITGVQSKIWPALQAAVSMGELLPGGQALPTFKLIDGTIVPAGQAFGLLGQPVPTLQWNYVGIYNNLYAQPGSGLPALDPNFNIPVALLYFGASSANVPSYGFPGGVFQLQAPQPLASFYTPMVTGAANPYNFPLTGNFEIYGGLLKKTGQFCDALDQKYGNNTVGTVLNSPPYTAQACSGPNCLTGSAWFGATCVTTADCCQNSIGQQAGVGSSGGAAPVVGSIECSYPNGQPLAVVADPQDASGQTLIKYGVCDIKTASSVPATGAVTAAASCAVYGATCNPMATSGSFACCSGLNLQCDTLTHTCLGGYGYNVMYGADPKQVCATNYQGLTDLNNCVFESNPVGLKLASASGKVGLGDNSKICLKVDNCALDQTCSSPADCPLNCLSFILQDNYTACGCTNNCSGQPDHFDCMTSSDTSGPMQGQNVCCVSDATTPVSSQSQCCAGRTISKGLKDSYCQTPRESHIGLIVGLVVSGVVLLVIAWRARKYYMARRNRRTVIVNPETNEVAEPGDDLNAALLAESDPGIVINALTAGGNLIMGIGKGLCGMVGCLFPPAEFRTSSLRLDASAPMLGEDTCDEDQQIEVTVDEQGRMTIGELEPLSPANAAIIDKATGGGSSSSLVSSADDGLLTDYMNDIADLPKRAGGYSLSPEILGRGGSADLLTMDSQHEVAKALLVRRLMNNGEDLGTALQKILGDQISPEAVTAENASLVAKTVIARGIGAQAMSGASAGKVNPALVEQLMAADAGRAALINAVAEANGLSVSDAYFALQTAFGELNDASGNPLFGDLSGVELPDYTPMPAEPIGF